MISKYIASTDKSVLNDMICEAKDQFDCAFEPSNLPECEQVLVMGSTIGMNLPISQSEWNKFATGCDSGATPFAVSGSPPSKPSAPKNLRAAVTMAEPTASSLAAASGSQSEAEPQSSAPAATEAPVPSEETAMSPSPARATPMPTSAEESTSTPQIAGSIVSKPTCTHDNDMVNMVVAMSPECFERCPFLCGALESLLLKFAGSPNPTAIEKEVCLAKDEFGCAFDPSNVDACQAVLSAGANFNVPQTGAELSRRCSVVSGGVAPDLDLGNSSDVDDDHDPSSMARPRAVVKGAVLGLAWATYML